MREEPDGVKRGKTIERKKDWPAWAEWFAVDGNGNEWVYARRPVRSNEKDYWILNGIYDPMVCVHDGKQ